LCSIVVSTGFCQYAVVPADGKNVLRDTSMISSELLAALKTQYGKNKIYPADMEKLVLYTLSFLPELTEHKITFKVRPKGAPLSSRPAWGTLWRSARKRRYMVFIHQGQDSSFFGSLFSKASIPAKIGILGHELCHVSNFSRKTSLGLIWTVLSLIRIVLLLRRGWADICGNGQECLMRCFPDRAIRLRIRTHLRGRDI
jgi:hypothetical protein